MRVERENVRALARESLVELAEETQTHMKRPLALAATAIALACSTTPAFAQDKSIVNAGNGVYLLYCASCHGPAAKGDGPASTAMNPKPTDLTKIAARNGGKFDDDAVFRTIDGRMAKAGHGGAGMPVWGDAFVRKGQDPGDARRKIESVVAYLKSLQGK